MPAAGAGPGEVQRGRPGPGITALLGPDLVGGHTDLRVQAMETAPSSPALRSPSPATSPSRLS